MAKTDELPPGAPTKRLYCFRRKGHEATPGAVLAGCEVWATDPAGAMKHLKLTTGRTADQGWFADDITDNRMMREWVRR